MTQPATPASSPPTPLMTRGFTVLLAVTGGFAVGNLYWAQPLLGLMSGDLDVSIGALGWLVTVTQLGYGSASSSSSRSVTWSTAGGSSPSCCSPPR